MEEKRDMEMEKKKQREMEKEDWGQQMEMSCLLNLVQHMFLLHAVPVQINFRNKLNK